jgi:hypothetical protein
MPAARGGLVSTRLSGRCMNDIVAVYPDRRACTWMPSAQKWT